jgi:Mor family transcriptional regulator
MSYIKADNVLPKEMIELIQKYIDGEYIYIPRKESNRKVWGETTAIKTDINNRNHAIYIKYLNGVTIDDLANEFYLSTKSIQRIVLQEKRK